jgi:hypothetical protein
MKHLALPLVLLFPMALTAQSFSVSFPKGISAQPLGGRLLLCLSTDPSDEPRNQIDDTMRSQIVFGMTVDGWQPDKPVLVDATAWGYPIRSLKDVPSGEYYVQAVLNKYEDFPSQRRKDRQAASGSGRGATLERLARQPDLKANEGHRQARLDSLHRAHRGDSAHPHAG